MNFRLVLAFACIANFSLLTLAAQSKSKSFDVIVTDASMRDPTANKLQPLRRVASRGRALSTVRYTLGARISGDKLVAQSSDVFAYPAPKDVILKITYPQEPGTGAVVTYVEIICDQGSSDGNAYVVNGGIGQHDITIFLEANQTEEFSYHAQFFGIE